MTYGELWKSLTAIYDEREAKAVSRYLLEVKYHLSMADVLGGAVPSDADESIRADIARLLRNEPIQYIIGEGEFCGRLFICRRGALIPRPETAGLCRLIVEAEHDSNAVRPLRVLDVGTGTGCIAVTLALDLPAAVVEAWDISDAALALAAENARRLNATVGFRKQDMTAAPLPSAPCFDLIVSNPPYVCNSEAAAMEPQVLDFEPHEALFVPDDDPLRYYRAVARYAAVALESGGRLYFEINPLFVNEMETMLHDMGFDSVSTYADAWEKPRMMKAVKP